MAKKGNIFDSAVKARVQEQEQITAAVTGTAPSTNKVAKTKITLSITPEDSDLVKMYALKNHTTVSDLLHEWIQRDCVE